MKLQKAPTGAMLWGQGSWQCNGRTGYFTKYKRYHTGACGTTPFNPKVVEDKQRYVLGEFTEDEKVKG